jgi:hypothetical protein
VVYNIQFPKPVEPGAKANWCGINYGSTPILLFHDEAAKTIYFKVRANTSYVDRVTKTASSPTTLYIAQYVYANEGEATIEFGFRVVREFPLNPERGK